MVLLIIEVTLLATVVLRGGIATYIQIGPLRYMSLMSAVPQQWKRRLVGTAPLSTDEKTTTSYIEVNMKNVLIQQIISLFFQSKRIVDRTPHPKLKWESEGVKFGEEWNGICI